MIRVVMEKGVGWDVMATAEEFSAWINDPDAEEMRQWVRWNGKILHIHKSNVQTIYEKENTHE
jgi:hypothetical protein